MTSSASNQPFPGFDKLERALGADRAWALIDEVKLEIGRANFDDPDSLFLLGVALTKRPGLLQAIGSALKVQALLHGANVAET